MQKIRPSSGAFAALLGNGRVLTWGDTSSGAAPWSRETPQATPPAPLFFGEGDSWVKRRCSPGVGASSSQVLTAFGHFLLLVCVLREEQGVYHLVIFVLHLFRHSP